MISSTIFALSSGQGRAAVAVIRVSGPATRLVLETLVGDVPPMRRASVRRLVIPKPGRRWTKLWLCFSRSSQLHRRGYRRAAGARRPGGGDRRLAGARPHRGMPTRRTRRVTRRAMENGKLDLTRVEGIADLIEAETAQQRRQALNQASGRLATQASAWRSLFIEAMAEIEAEIDFADEGDVAALDRSRIVDSLRTLAEGMRAALDDGRRGERLRAGIHRRHRGSPERRGSRRS